MNSDLIFVYMTVATANEAETIARTLLEKRLVACANIMSPHKALYWWDGEIQSDEEVVMIVKTRAVLFEQVRAAVCELHSYDCPCIVALPITDGHKPYMDWIFEETQSAK